MRIEHRHLRNLFVALLLSVAGNHAYATATVDCTTVMTGDKTDTIKLNPADVNTCMIRGWDPPVKWRPKDGKGGGANFPGSRGFNYGAVQAPESPPGKQNANASVSRGAITNSCNFPPRIQIGLPPKVSMPTGSCLDFLNDVFKDKNGALNSSPPDTGIAPTDTCPAESDTTGIYGVKSSIASGGSVTAPCGGVVPTTATDLTLNANPTHLAATSGNKLWAYRKSGNTFVTILNGVALPTYLCSPGRGGKPQNTLDLTPASDQMIAYKAADGALSIRLQPRETMDLGFKPPYVATDPEKYLVLPLSAAGVPTVPANCSSSATYYKTPVGRQEIQIQAITDRGCEGSSFSATPYNDISCGVFGCKNNWKWICTDDISTPPTASEFHGPTSGPPTPPCPQSAGIPPSTCTASTPSTDANCDIITVKPTGAACADKTQYGVLNRPGLYYPSGATANFYTVSGRTAVMAETTKDTKFFTQSNTTILVQQSTAPAITFEEGGTLIFKDKSMLLMNPTAVLAAGAGSVTMQNGGQLLSAGGTQLQTFGPNSLYAIPSSLATNPLEVHVGRSITLPAGYLIPSTPTVGAQPPYMRLPVDAPVP